MKTVIEMAREADIELDLIDEDEGQVWYITKAGLERFASLIAAAERNRTWTQEHWTEYERNIAAAAKAEEREACAKLCDEKVDAEYATGKVDHNEMGWTQACAIAIRARKENT